MSPTSKSVLLLNSIIPNTTQNINAINNEAVGNKIAFLIDKDLEFSLIGLKIKAILTPGHTKDSTSYLIEKNLFSGDFLFKRSIGRMDLASGSESDMRKSINKIVTYDIETIYPGHGRDTSLDYELRNNSFIKRFLNY